MFRVQKVEKISDLNTLARLYHSNLARGSATHALEYVGSRGITSEQINKHLIGYSDLFTSHKKTKMSREIINLVARGGKDFFYNKITFPIQYNGRVVNFTSRTLSGGVKYLHMPGKITHAFNQDILSTSNWAVICEGPIDCLTLERWGIPAVGLLGIHSTPSSLVTGLHDKKVFICFDSEPNKAGSNAADKLARKLLRFDIRASIVHLPEGNKKIDVNDFSQDHTGEDFYKLLGVARVYKGRPSQERKYEKEDGDIIEVARKYMEVFQSGSKFKAACPFHKETKPSLVFYPDGTGFCFGCGEVVTISKIEKHFKSRT